MDIKPLDEALTEINAIKPPTVETEGLRDLLSLNLKSETKAEVQSLLNEYEQRDALLLQLRSELTMTRATMLTLLKNGYPELPSKNIAETAFGDLKENRFTIEAAFGLFRGPGDGATLLQSIVSEEQPIP